MPIEETGETRFRTRGVG